MSVAISAIDKESVHKICSGQVVLDLATAVKELVENSLDAGANSVEINFKESGVDGFEVVDNGSGIDPSNYESLALKHYTSKLKTFEDLESVLTFGFRGEALSSLCALSKLTVITATKEQSPMGYKLEYDFNGVLVSKNPVSRTQGTTIQLSDIFHSLPVRLQEFKRNIKREFSKALVILQAYSIISQNTRISVNNQVGKKPKTKIMATTMNKEISANISNVFGAKLVSQIIPFKVDLESVLGIGSVEGYISKPDFGLGRSSSDRQYFYVNGRPCTLPKIAKTLNEIYRIYIANQYPVIIANLKIPTDSYDVNVSPDKRTIFIHNEIKISEMIMEQLKEKLEPSRSTFQLNPLMSSSSFSIPSSLPKESKETEELSPSQGPMRLITTESNSSLVSSETTSSLNLSKPTTSLNLSKPISNLNLSRSNSSFSLPKTNSSFSLSKPSPSLSSYSRQPTLPLSTKRTITNPKDTLLQPKKPKVQEEDLEMAEPDQEYVETTAAYTGLCTTLGRHLTFQPDLTPRTRPKPIEPHLSRLSQKASIQVTDHQEAANALSRVITKPDFERMRVLGQFNLGFMITSLDEQDLYIIDQHASDEKYNFETLQKTTIMKGQRLIRPPVLDLTAAEEHVVMDHLEIFKANGFELEILPDQEPTQRIRVVSQPVSKNTMFDKKDFSELIYLIRENPGEMVRCSKTRAMFASRACHKAARIGDSLNMRQMTTIVRHMGEIDQPWNCPHGRPTMRHLFSLAEFKQSYTKPSRTLTFSGSLQLQKES